MAEQGQSTSVPPPASPAPAPKQSGRIRGWLMRIRTNSRLAYVFQISSRLITSAMALFWIRMLVGVMGKPLNSLYLAFQNIFTLGNLGDLGVGGAIGIRAGQYLGEGKEKEAELLSFLASARTVFLLMIFVFAGGMYLLSPRLPDLFHFPSTVPEAGSLSHVFGVGTLIIAGLLMYSYTSNVNYACGNIAWPALPDFLMLQVCLVCHWWLARQGEPLWVQFLPYLASGIAKVWLTWFYVRVSHPYLSPILPLRLDLRLAANLIEGSFWVYLCCLGNAVYRSTDALVINAGFRAGTLSDYIYNYKFCELTMFVVGTASFVILPKMTQWMASPDPKDQERARFEMRRLNQFQSLLGCGAALSYLAFNTLFMKIWWLHKANPILPAPVSLQIAFALNMAVSACGDTGLQLALRSGKQGLRAIGGMVGITATINVALSILAMKRQWLEGIALATVVAQVLLMLGSSHYLCRRMQLKWLPWALKGCVLPLIGAGFAGWLRMLWPMDTVAHVLLLLGSYAALFLVAAWGLGIDKAMLKEELKIVGKLLGRG